MATLICIEVTCRDGGDPVGSPFDLIIAAPQGEGEAELILLPERFCPGWYLYATFYYTNTGTVALTNVTITSPLSVWASDGEVHATSGLPGLFDEDKDEFLFKVAELAPDETAMARVRLHSYSTTTGVVEDIFLFTADQLLGMDQVSATAVVDDSLCGDPPAQPDTSPTDGDTDMHASADHPAARVALSALDRDALISRRLKLPP